MDEASHPVLASGAQQTQRRIGVHGMVLEG